MWKVISYAPLEQFPPGPETIQDVFKLWGCTWLWKNIWWQGELDWLVQSIQQGDCMVVADGSYMPEIRTDLCSTAFFFECKAGRGRVVGSLADFNTAANAYRGELLGLMAVHLVLTGIARLYPNLSGKVEVYSDCAGAINKLVNLPSG